MNIEVLSGLLTTANIDLTIDHSPQTIVEYKQSLKATQNKLYDLYDQGIDVGLLVKARSQFTDRILSLAWQHYFPQEQNIALLAVGGYGREELHPHSDVDILILFETDNIELHKNAIESFVTFLWDISLEIGSSVRTIDECISEARNDITIATNIVESRLICGCENVYAAFEKATTPDLIWSSKDFFEAKCLEQKRRHQRFHDTAYNLEPNVKESPGGLRDIHMVGWITKRHFGDKSLADLVNRGFLTAGEYKNLLDGQTFLWKIRFGLHMIAGRREDRLLFEHQRVLARNLGYKDESAAESPFTGEDLDRPADGHRLAVEIFMKEYYRTIMQLNLLNEILLQHYQETILFNESEQYITQINKRFQAINNYIEVKNEKTFTYYPFSLLEVFLLLQQNKQFKGIRASTIRLIRENLHLIDDDFRNDLRCRSLFMEILKQPQGVTSELRHMNRCGILGKYLPEFGKIIGQMQFDLFHIYTVDEHTLFVVRNLRRFFVEEHQHEYPLCSHLIRTIPKPELLYIAGLYHDIAKGRGGDHSMLGENDVRLFCQRHGLSHYDTELVAWLVRNHLLMSATAQHKDLSDPDVINKFASKVENSIKLDYLYLLTVADIRGTNNNLWNSWKDSLLKTLRQEAQKAMRRGLDNPLQKVDLIKNNQETALQLVKENNLDETAVKQLWQQLGDDFLFRYSPLDIYQHTNEILADAGKETIIHINPVGASGGTDIFLKTPIRNSVFSNTTRALDLLNLNIVEAKIVSSSNNYSLNTYTVLELDGNNVNDEFRIQEIEKNILKALETTTSEAHLKNKPINRRIECFAQPTEILFENDAKNNRTILEIITTDRPGLLSKIAFVLMKQGIETLNAKITTLGAQVDDVFFVHDVQSKNSLTPEAMNSLREELLKNLDYQ